MASLDDDLARWRNAGLIDAAQAERIRAYEAARGQERAAGSLERPGLLEALLYLGVAVLTVGVVTLVAQNWEELRSWARIAALLVPAALLLLAGQAMRASGQAAVARASTVAWLAGVALVAGGIGVIGAEADWEGRVTTIAAGGTATALALLLWAVQPSHPQVVAVAGALVLLAIGAATWPDRDNEVVAGLLIALFGGLMVALTERSLFGPAESARVLGAAGLIAGLLIAAYTGDDDGRLWLEALVFAAGAALIALGLVRSRFDYLVVGVGGTFVALVAFVFRHFEDELGAPVVLLLSGAFVIAAGLLLAFFRGRFARAEPV